MEGRKKTVDFVKIPEVIKKSAAFCVWKYEKRNGQKTKVPYDPETGRMARTNDPGTFREFSTAVRAFVAGGYDGVGFRVSEGIGAIDIDHCLREDGTINDVAASVLGAMEGCYFEKSPSGTGLRGFFKVPTAFAYDKSVYMVNNRTLGLEVYLPGTTNRFVTVTGDEYKKGGVPEDMGGLSEVLDTYMKRKTRKVNTSLVDPKSYLSDDAVVERASASESGEKFTDLFEGRWQERYNSQSEADVALCDILAFWCGCDEEQIDRVFRRSGLMRDKWDRPTGDSTYGGVTIRNAILGTQNIYVPMTGSTAAEDFADTDEDERPRFSPALGYVTQSLEEMRPHANPRYGGGEIGMGHLYADYYKEVARFDEDRQIWMIYDGNVWQEDRGSLGAMWLAKALAARLAEYSNQLGKGNDAFAKAVAKLWKRSSRVAMISDARDEFPIRNERFDANKYFFNCANCTIDLRDGSSHSHRAEDFITKMSPVVYKPDAPQGRWRSFIHEVMQGEDEVARFFQKAIGYSLSGDTSLECLFILFGPTTRNGKTTSMNTILSVMGDYGVTSKSELMATATVKVPQGDGPTETLATLKGARFIGISEMEQRLKLNTALVKQMTGNMPIRARFLHENSFTFRMQGKIFLDTNYLPDATDPTIFDSGRIKVIPFTRHFEEHEQDKGLKEKLSEPEQLSDVLNWCLEGYRMFKAEGLEPPKEVTDSTEQYREESDLVMMFAAQRLKKEAGKELSASAAYREYKNWCADNGYHYDSAQRFRKSLSKKFEVVKRRPWSKEGNQNANNYINDVTWLDEDDIDADLA